MANDLPDRRVHAVFQDGGEIVRYDRAGKWWYERGDYRRQLSLNEAVQFVSDESQWNRGVPGGRTFDSRVARKLEGLRRVS